jgi:hypothetical protein
MKKSKKILTKLTENEKGQLKGGFSKHGSGAAPAGPNAAATGSVTVTGTCGCESGPDYVSVTGTCGCEADE